jgi:hypothetical protein
MREARSASTPYLFPGSPQSGFMATEGTKSAGVERGGLRSAMLQLALRNAG